MALSRDRLASGVTTVPGMSEGQLDGVAVGRAITEAVRPHLRRVGFTKFTPRKSWRFGDETIDLVNFRSFSSYIAGGVGCTTYSFSVTTGVYYRCLDREMQKPDDYHLTFRIELGKSVRQPWFRPFGGDRVTDRPDVWYVLPDGSNLAECIEDAADQLIVGALPMIDRLDEPEAAYRALLTETSRNPDFGSPGLAMPGAPDSPRWRDVTLAIGHLVVPDPRVDMRSAPVLRE